MNELEWLALEDPQQILEYLQLEWHLRTKVRILRSWRLFRWFAPKMPQADNQRPLFSERQLYLLACAIDREWWWANNCEAPPRFEVQERFAEGELTLAELLAGVPQVQWPWAEPWRLLFELVRRACVATAFERLQRVYCNLTRDIFGNPFRPVVLDSSWLTSDVLTLARGIYEEKAFDRMPVLADALQDAGCTNEDVLNHCRGDGPHVRGCWVVDLLLGKE